MLGNREVMAKNLKRLMASKGVNATDVCRTLHFKHNTFSSWVNCNTYPRIDKIEMMAKYFGVSKSALIEDYTYDIDNIDESPEDSFNKEAIAFYTKYLSADKKIRKMIDMLLEEGE